ncbi:hypothetical protein ACIPUB_09905 [Paeniglutamicibacter sp. ORCA_105]|uniref:hypothetical protein n=1 Tax=Paeniglutamicibacter sp. ORCA_105 TaxID=3377336 RepID=UPI003894336E
MSLVMATAILALAGCSASDPYVDLAPADAAFMNDMSEAQGLQLGNVEAHKLNAQVACERLRLKLPASKSSALLVVTATMTQEEKIEQDEASRVLHVSAKHFCPEFEPDAAKWRAIASD